MSHAFTAINERLPNPVAPFSFRAECSYDAIQFLKEIIDNAIETGRQVLKLELKQDMMDGEVTVEFYSNIGLGVMQNTMRCLETDGNRIMIQTLRPVMASENSFKRDYDIC